MKYSPPFFPSRSHCPYQKPMGILGAGQLARMLAIEAHRLGYPIHVLSESAKDPAAQVLCHWYEGSARNKTHLKKFLQRIQILTFENEFIDVSTIRAVKKTLSTPLKIFPSLSNMEKLQWRFSQKVCLEKQGIPSATFMPIRKVEDLQRAEVLLGSPFVLKAGFGGYDGYGTFMLGKKEDPTTLEKIFHTLKQSPNLKNSQPPFIAEKKVLFKRELALVMVRDRFSRILTLPLVQTQQTQSRCDWVCGPIHHPKLKPLLKKLHTFLHHLNYVGAIAFELFEERGSGNLLVNEVAPRVHNSGHYSLDFLSESQFSLHIKAVTGEPLPSKISQRGKAFAMVNLLGQSRRRPQWKRIVSGTLYWYGKEENRPGRKMGHLHCEGESPQRALQKALKARENFLLSLVVSLISFSLILL